MKIVPLPAGTVASLRGNGLGHGRGRSKWFDRTVLSARTTRLRNEASSP